MSKAKFELLHSVESFGGNIIEVDSGDIRLDEKLGWVRIYGYSSKEDELWIPNSNIKAIILSRSESET